MRILIVGAGALGGYFGGRLLQAQRDVTFLVRKRRATQLRGTGLVITSPLGDYERADPPLIDSESLREPFDLILLGCKAYDLENAIESFAPAVAAHTAILPLLNGIRHLDVLEARFGTEAVLGGQCLISAALDQRGHILHLNDLHTLAFGELRAARSDRTDAILQEFATANFDARLSDTILLAMWEKWAFIAAAAGITCLMRASVGDIVNAGAADLAARIYEECAQIATDAGFAPRAHLRQRSLDTLTQPGSGLTASMLRDIEAGGRTEADHLLGDLLRRRSPSAAGMSLLAIAHAHVAAYESRRKRESEHRGGNS